MTRFALIGAAGYIAPRHLQAISAVGGDLAAALDRSDSVGIMDRYFPDTAFFTEFERFEAHLADLRNQGQGVDYIGICSPNYLHASHIRTALVNGAHAICEKPLVLEEAELDVLAQAEQASGKRVYTILQLRLHPAILELRAKLAEAPAGTVHEVDVTYCTSRGGWYSVSWKGDIAKSGGIATNIGVHFFDMLVFLFGDILESARHLREDTHAAGWLKLERANVRWFLSIDRNHLPDTTPQGQTTYRSITVDGSEIEFSGGFTDLHTQSYQDILGGGGFGLEDARGSIRTVADMRRMALDPDVGEQHPFVERFL
ncbi:MAG: Gfo/Idh/MocA family oxidoreductase [Pseudomonadota bacterium]